MAQGTNKNISGGEDWKITSEIATSLITPNPVIAMAATLDHPTSAQIGAPLPELWHWLYFWPLTPQADLLPDGHAEKGPIPDFGLPRRMFAGTRATFHAPVKIGQTVSRRTRVADVTEKSGKNGRLVFVKLKHELHDQSGQLLLDEERDIVFREPPRPGAPQPEPQSEAAAPVWHRQIVPTEALLFRYSALTFNSHRIHFDHPYTTQVEGYPGLIVHGPLIATLLVDLVRRSVAGAKLRTVSLKAIRPTFLGHHFTVCGRPLDNGKDLELWAKDHDGYVTMTAKAVLA